MDYSRFITEQTPSKKKIILISAIASAVLVGLIILLIALAINKKSPKTADPTSTEVSGEFVLEQEKASPTSTSTDNEEVAATTGVSVTIPAATETTETATKLPKTGSSDMLTSALLLGLIAALSAYNLKFAYEKSTFRA